MRIWQRRSPIPDPSEIHARTEKRRQRDAIIPLPKTRARALSIGAPGLGVEEKRTYRTRRKPWEQKERVHQVRQLTIDQLGLSGLWKLPPEIREQVWKYALGGHHIHIVKRRKRLASVYCPAKDPTSSNRRDLCLLTRDREGYHKRTAWPPHPGPVSLLLTCRQIYSEAVNFLYSHNTFSFDDHDLVITLFDCLLPKRKNLITSIHFSFGFLANRTTNDRAYIYEPSYLEWGTCCRKLRKLPDLRRLVVTPTFYHNPEQEMSRNQWRYIKTVVPFLQWVDSIQVKEEFSVTVPWDMTPRHLQKFPFVGTDEQLIPANPNFEVKRATQYPPIYCSDNFSFPCSVVCLHCEPGVIIPQGTKGSVEHLNFERIYTESWKSSLFTFHTRCGGWIGFEWERSHPMRAKLKLKSMGRWRPVQGAREVSQEDMDSFSWWKTNPAR